MGGEGPGAGAVCILGGKTATAALLGQAELEASFRDTVEASLGWLQLS